MKISRIHCSMILAGILFTGTNLFAQKPDRSAPPKLGPPPSLKLPDIKKTNLPNGLKIVIMESRKIPLVQITVQVDAGQVNDGKGKEGIAAMTFSMLDEGAGKRDALSLSDALNYLGATLRINAGIHSSTISLNTPASKLDAALDLLADIVLRPTFDETELSRLRKQQLTNILQAHDNPRVIASAAYAQILFGKDHIYGSQRTGTEQSIKAMKAADIRSFHKKYISPPNTTMIIVGDIDADGITAHIEKRFGTWRGTAGKAVKVKTAKQVQKRIVYLVDKPGAAQSIIHIGRIGVTRKTPDYYPITVMNTVLGGSFTSRLNSNLREEHGYSYGAFSRFSFRPSPGAFTATSAVQTDVTDKALTEFMKELNGIRQPIPEIEFNRAKNYSALQFPSRFQTVSQIAGQLADLIASGIPESYFGEYVQQILNVTAAEVKMAAEKYIVPEKSIILVVGDRAKIEPGIQALKLGPIKNLTIEDVLGKKPELN